MAKLILLAFLTMFFIPSVLAELPHKEFCSDYELLYARFELQPGATINNIKAAFRTVSKKHHPDMGGNATIFEIYVDTRDYILKMKDKYDPVYAAECYTDNGTAFVLTAIKWSLFAVVSIHQKKIAYFEWNFAMLSFVFGSIELPINFYVDTALAALCVLLSYKLK